MSKTMTECGARIGERRAAGDGEIGLGAPVDDLELDVELGLDAGDELGAVVGEPAGLGRDEARPGRRCGARILLLQTRSASIVRSIAASLRRFADAQALAEPHDAREGVDDAKAVRRGLRDEQAAIVGAEIERRVGMAVLRRGPAVMRVRPGRPAVVPDRLRRGQIAMRARRGDVPGRSGWATTSSLTDTVEFPRRQRGKRPGRELGRRVQRLGAASQAHKAKLRVRPPPSRPPPPRAAPGAGARSPRRSRADG